MSAVVYVGMLVSCTGSDGADPGAINRPLEDTSTSTGGTSSTGTGGATSSGASTSTGGSVATTGGASSAGSGGSAGASSAGSAGAVSNAGSGGFIDDPSKRTARIAFFGDQGATSDTELALQELKEHKPDLAVVLGDFDYVHDPAAWKKLMDDSLGADFPWIAVGGNHDVQEWSGYQKIIEEKVKSIAGLEYTGTPGDSGSYKFKGVQIVMSGIKTFGTDADQLKALEDNLKAATLDWKVCAWHKNHQDMNTGRKGVPTQDIPFDEVPIQTYALCAQYGAFVMTGHEHAYSRTRTLGCLGDRDKQHCPDSAITNQVEVGGGKSFVTVSGLGGREIREFVGTFLFVPIHDDDTWWASYYTRDREMVQGEVTTIDNSKAGVGITFVDFGIDGDPKKARGFFKVAQNGRIVDEYTIVRK